MHIQRTKEGCTIIPDSAAVDRVEYEYDSGLCTIWFSNGEKSSLHPNWDEMQVFHVSGYGLAFTEDGSLFLTGSWYKGLFGVDSRSGKTLWHYRKGSIQDIFILHDYAIVHRCGQALLKMNPYTGEVLGEITGQSLDSCWRLDEKHFALNRKNGFLCIVNADKMEIVSRYSTKETDPVFNPRRCRSCCVQEVWLEDNKVMLKGFEEYPNWDRSAAGVEYFVRCLGEFQRNSETD